jgi:hypothetical protein
MRCFWKSFLHHEGRYCRGLYSGIKCRSVCWKSTDISEKTSSEMSVNFQHLSQKTEVCTATLVRTSKISVLDQGRVFTGPKSRTNTTLSEFRWMFILKNAVFWDVMPCAHAGSSFAGFSTMKMEAIRSSETSVHTRSTRRHIPEDSILHSHRRENLKSYTMFILVT